ARAHRPGARAGPRRAPPSLDLAPEPAADAEPGSLVEHVHGGEAVMARARPGIEPGAGVAQHALSAGLAREGAEHEVPGVCGAVCDLLLDLTDGRHFAGLFREDR